MSQPRTISSLCFVILVLAIWAAGSGVGLLWQQAGSSYQFTSLRGETVEIYGHGLYRYDSVMVASQGIAQDAVTLLIGVPLLLVSLLWALRGSLRGRLLLLGTLGYFLYGYAAFAFGAAAYNSLYLVYVALFALSLFAFLLVLNSIDIASLPDHFAAALPHRGLSLFGFFVGAFLLMSWLGRIVPSLSQEVPPLGLQTYSTLVIQTLDLALIVPLAFISGILLWRRTAWGYLLMSILLLKGLTLALSITAGVIGQAVAGIQLSFGEVVIFPLLTLIDLALTYVLLKNVIEGPKMHITVTREGQAVNPRLAHDHA
ncbi:MAG: hypothetical protein KF726_19205 [Anaerolineae bacterium]|nr:hypothetical protein [Anaerolineae bacterium]